MKTKTRKREKVTLKDIVQAAHAAGAKVSVSLSERAKTDLSKLRRNAAMMRAVWLLAETRSMAGLDAAYDLLREVDTIYNDTIFLLQKTRDEVIKRPLSESNHFPVP
jgi:hypothetical protein